MSKKTVYDKIVDWFDVRFGFAKTPLKPIPLFTLNPIYWLGALMVVSFVLQGITGMFMLLYYTPTPTQAYSSTTYIINSVPFGHLVETFHLYNAYAMILLAFLHLVRNYFGSAEKEHRDLMWLAGIALGLVVLTFGVTGYLLPWTVISKSATDVAIGFTNFLPPQLGDLGRFILTGSGGDAAELNSFLHIHTILLPWTLAALVGLKVYMYEVHGPIYVPAYGKLKVAGGSYVRWFPQVFLFGVMLVSVFVATLLAVSSLFPLVLPPQFTPATAGAYVVQPDWYLLWVYQILKFEAFEGAGASIAFVMLTILVLLLLLLPFIDRSKRRGLTERPVYVTIGVVWVSELMALTIWGYLTPGQVIPNYQAVFVIGIVALGAIVLSWLTYRLYRRQTARTSLATSPTPTPTAVTTPKMGSSKMKRLTNTAIRTWQSLLSRFTFMFMLPLAVASMTLASLMNMLPTVLSNLPIFIAISGVFGFSVYVMCLMLRRLVQVYEQQREVTLH